MSNILHLNDLKPDSWYVPVFERFEPLDEFGNFQDQYRTDSPYYLYLGNGEFQDESGELVYSFFDPELGMQVATGATDGFIR